jgi:hypothetical protein
MEEIWNSNPEAVIAYKFEDGNIFIDKKEADNYAVTIHAKYEVVEKETEVKPTKKQK